MIHEFKILYNVYYIYDYFIKISRHQLAIYTYIILNIIMYVHIYSIDPWT